MSGGEGPPPSGRVAWFQCTAGASGDMMLGALVGAGAPLESLQRAVDALGVDPIRLAVHGVRRHGLAATKVTVSAAPSAQLRTWRDIRQLLAAADLPERVRTRALDVFARLARAEAYVHRVQPEEVHFHEVGALDALADVVGACAALDELGVAAAIGSAIAVGSGVTRAAHGVLPVPAPAVVMLLAEAGAPVYSGEAPYEMCTPTGAALLAATCRGWGGLPPMRVVAQGFGAGERDLTEVPNVLRVVVGDAVAAELGGDASDDTALMLESNVDDLDPRLWPGVLSRLLAAGAADAWLTPILMKKGRPAHTLSVLLSAEAAAAVQRVLFTETSTIGLREVRIGKRALNRRIDAVIVGGHEIRIKVALFDGAVVNAQPEYEDVARVAERLGRPVKAVLAAANAAAHAAGLGP
jgi:pyridinium-3,5-bisthiocarboxylic acid mononucleotide nickel chelatase